jgi:hypothetical protein
MGVEKVPNTLAAGIKATGGEGEGGPRDGTLSGPPAAASVPPASGEHEGGEVREGSGILPSLSGIGGAGGELATQSRDTLALADVAAMDESARAYYANLGKMAVDRIEEALDDGLLDGGPKDHVANVAYLIPDGLDALIALARRNRGGGAGDEATETIERLRAERDALKADLARAESFAVSHEAWEACMVSHNPAWEPGGMAEFPRLVQPLWDAALGLQGRRNRVLGVARQAGRVGSAGDLEHAWEAVRGLAGLDPEPKADPGPANPATLALPADTLADVPASGGEGESV